MCEGEVCEGFEYLDTNHERHAGHDIKYPSDNLETWQKKQVGCYHLF